MSIKHVVAFAAFFCILIFSSAGFCQTNILNIRHWAAPDHTRIVIDTSDDADINVVKETKKITVEFKNAHYPDEMVHEFVLNKRGIQRITVTAPTDSSVNVSLELADGAEGAVFKLPEVAEKPFRVVIDLKFPDIEKKESEERKKVKISQKDKIIIIDPGHGGEDPGAIGRNKTMEKDVVLAISKKLEWLINHRKGYRAFLTRDADYYPSFKKRLQIAKEYGADLFLSVHADASRSRQPQGTSVYVLSTTGASSAAARLLARQENLADIVGGSDYDQNNDESDPIILNMIQTETINMSKSLGRIVLDRMEKINAIKFPVVQEAQFIVLKLPHIPSILVETGFISNPHEEKLLKNNKHQNRIALALSASIQTFLRDPEPDTDSVHIALAESQEEGKVEAALPPEQNDSKPLPRLIVYKVKKGDSLKSIARQFGTSPEALIKLNHLKKNEPFSKRSLKVYLTAQAKEQPEARAVASSIEKSGKDSRTPVSPAPSVASTVYVVKNGDSIARIAQRHHISTDDLIAANKLKPDAPLYIGRKLTLPASNHSSAEEPAEKNVKTDDAPKASEPPPASSTVYVVKNGDSIARIAQRHHISTDDLIAANKLKPDAPLYIGRKLILPASDHSSAEEPAEKNVKTDDAPKASDPPPASSAVYVVKNGDSIARIAQRHHISTDDLIAANKLKPDAPLYIGKKLAIPASNNSAPAEKPGKKNAPKSVAPTSEKTSVHVVKPGDSLARIAQKYKVTIGALLKFNQIKLKDPLLTGQRIKIPESSDRSQPRQTVSKS